MSMLTEIYEYTHGLVNLITSYDVFHGLQPGVK